MSNTKTPVITGINVSSSFVISRKKTREIESVLDFG